MTLMGRSLPRDVVEQWPEVFGEVKFNVLPLRYLQAVLVNFKDGKSWEIKITAKTKKEGWDSFEKSLSELFKAYEDRIKDIDLKLDSDRIRKDIEKTTERFLKKKTI